MTKHTVRERLLASTMIGGATLVALSAAPAFAADQPASTTVGEVVVTGSRIPHPNLTSVSPLTTVGSQDIKLQGVQNVEDLINSLPQAFADFGAMQSNGATGTATVNLRNLGNKRTLVLIDGKRLQPGDPNLPVADLNFIPSALVDRVDIVTGGASAVYGSDAIAGVVNFVMKKDFEGLRIDVQYGFDQHNQHNQQIKNDVANSAALVGNHIALPTGSVTDGGRTSVSIVGGANSTDGAGNVTFYFNYQHSDAVLEGSRDFTACSTATNTGTVFQYCGGSSTSFPGRFTINNAANPNHGHSFTIDGSGNVVPFTNANLYNFAPLNYLQRPDERYTAGEFSHYQLNPHLDVYSSFMFMHDASFAQIAGSGAFFGDPYSINCGTGVGGNPLLTASEQAKFCAGVANGAITNLEIGRRDVEGVGRVSKLEHFDYRFVIGARGEIADGWNYDVYAQYGHSDLQSEDLGFFSIAKTNNALDVISDGAGGVECASAAARAQGCVPWNIWNNPAHPGGVTAAQLAYLETTAAADGQTSEQIVSANLTGDLGKYGFKSPWAKDGVGVSLGAEYRRESLDTSFDGAFTSGDLAGLGGAPQPVTGAFDVKELFGEVRVPLVQDVQFAKEITFEGGYRYANYSSAGAVDAEKLALDWQINPDIRLRGSFQRAVRAPNVNELFTPQTPGLVPGTDPCAGSSPTFTAAQCAATGVLAGQYGNIIQCVSSQCAALAGGNPALKPEDSNTKSFGAVFTPTFLPGFNLSVDWFDINVKNVITTPTLTNVFANCAAGQANFCALIHRQPGSGQVFGSGGFVSLPLFNAGTLHTRGVDMEANYHVALSDWGMGDHGSLNLNVVGTATSLLNGGTNSLNCAGLFGTTCGTPTPKWRHKARLTWVTPWNVSLSGQWRYISGSALDFTEDHGGIATDRHIPAYNYFDLSGEWRIRDRMTLHAGVNNVFDKDPPILDSNSYGIASPPFGNGNTYPQVYDALGRTIFIGITADF